MCFLHGTIAIIETARNNTEANDSKDGELNSMPKPKDNHLYKNKYLNTPSMTLRDWMLKLKLGSCTIQKRKREGVLYREELGEV